MQTKLQHADKEVQYYRKQMKELEKIIDDQEGKIMMYNNLVHVFIKLGQHDCYNTKQQNILSTSFVIINIDELQESRNEMNTAKDKLSKVNESIASYHTEIAELKVLINQSSCTRTSKSKD